MTVNEIFTLIGSYGFPIVMSIVLMWYIYKQGESHKEEVRKLSEVIDTNTKVLTRLQSIVEVLEHDIRE